MKKLVLSLATILLSNVAHAGAFSAIYSMVQKSAGKAVQLRQVEREVSITIGVEQVATRIPAHEFTLANGLIVQMEDVGKIVRNSKYEPLSHDMGYNPAVDFVVTIPLAKVPKSKEALVALNAKFKALDNEVNGIRGLTQRGPMGFYSGFSESSRRLTVTADVDAGKLDELIQSTFAKLGALDI